MLNLDNTALFTREEVVANALRKAILRGAFKPGEKLDQNELAHALGVSRSPVREALRTLAAEDLITIFPHRGAVVNERAAAELRELLFMRSLLEGAAARRAAPLMTDEQLCHLKQLMTQADQAGSIEEVLDFNNDFHSTIYSAYEQPHLMGMIQILRNKIAPYNRIYLERPGGQKKAWADHRKIYEACLARDGERAERETILHLEQVFDGIMEAIEK